MCECRPVQQRRQGGAGARIESGECFVEQQDSRPAHQRAREQHAPRLPVRGADAVDAASEFVPSRVAPLAIPLGFAGETADAAGTMPCAPASGNYAAFYQAATAAPWAAEWTLAGAGHLDFVDDCPGVLCQVCQGVTGDKTQVRASTHTLEVAFFRRHLDGEAALEAFLTGASLPPGVTVRHR